MPTHHRPARGIPPASLGLLALGLIFLGGRPAHAQPQVGNQLPTPRLLLVSPPGGKAGTSVEVVLTGTDLDQPERLLFSHPGIKGELVAAPKPPPPDPKKPKKPNKPPRPGMGQPAVTRFLVTIPADAPVGIHDVRLVNKWGVSNPRAFVVGDLPEVMEKEPNNDQPQAQRVELNSTVNGSMTSPTDVDYYVFSGKKGQRVVLSCPASSIDSRFHAALEVYDDKNHLLADNRNYNGYDALADLSLPEDGDYYVRVFQFTHTMANMPGIPPTPGDHFYRLTLSTAPWIDAVFPSVVEPGKTTSVTVYGRNLPGGKPDPTARVGGRVLETATVKVTAPAQPDARERLAFSGMIAPPASTLSELELRLRNDVGSSNPFLLTTARAPVVLDKGDNDTPDTAQEITLPCEIAGHIEKRRDRDWYAFEAKKGERYSIEVTSGKVGAPTYMFFMLRNAANKQYIVEELPEENPNNFSRKFYTRNQDPPAYRFTVPADGKYQLLVGSRVADTVAGPRHLYTVRITPEQPDFRLVAMAADNGRPDAATLLAGGNQAFTVFAFRQDNFVGDIVLTAEGLPPGVTCVPQTLGGDLRQAQLVVSAAAGAAAWTGEIKIKGTAVIKGQKVVREARSASIVWPVLPQLNIPVISRLDRGLMLAVREQAPFNLTTSLDREAVFHGEKATLKVKLARLWPDFKGPLQLTALASQQRQGTNLPINLRVNNGQPFNLNAAEAALPITIGPDVVPGSYNLVLRAQGQVPYDRNPGGKQKRPTFVVQYSTPVTLTVKAKSLGTLALSNQSPTVKVGNKAEVVVRVQRLFRYEGEFKLEVVLPPAVKGVEVEPAVIPEGANEARLVVKVPAGTAPGFRPNLVVRATATYQGNTASQEVKFNVNVVK